MNKSATRFVIRIRGVSLDCSTCSDKRCSKWGQVTGKKEEECKTRDEIIGHSFVLESNRICQREDAPIEEGSRCGYGFGWFDDNHRGHVRKRIRLPERRDGKRGEGREGKLVQNPSKAPKVVSERGRGVMIII